MTPALGFKTFTTTSTDASPTVVSLGLSTPPTWLHVRVSSKTSGETQNHVSYGKATAVKQTCTSELEGSPVVLREDYIVYHREIIAGVPTVVLAVRFKDFSGNNPRFVVDIANTSYKCEIEAGY